MKPLFFSKSKLQTTGVRERYVHRHHYWTHSEIMIAPSVPKLVEFQVDFSDNIECKKNERKICSLH